MKPPTVKQVKSEIAALKELRDKIPPRTAFGDDNLARIDAEIDVLENDLSINDVDQKYGDDDAVYESATYALQWIDGEAEDGSMSDNWRPLAGVKVQPIK